MVIAMGCTGGGENTAPPSPVLDRTATAGVPGGGTAESPARTARQEPSGPGAPSPTDGSPHWLSYGNGPKNQFYNAAETQISVETAPKIKVLWRIAIGEVTGAPAVVGDRVYAASSSGLHAVNATDGSVLWTADIRSTSSAFYDLDSKLLIVSSSDGRIHGVDAMTGELTWTSPITAQPNAVGWSSPIVSGDLAVVGISSIDTGNFKGGVAAFDKLTGTRAWEYVHAKTDGASVWSGPGADGDGVIYATSGNNYGRTDDRSDAIFAVSPRGEMLWNFQAEPGDAWSLSMPNGGPEHDFGANPIIVDVNGRKLVAAGRKSGEFHLLDRITGEEIARHKICDVTSRANGGILNNGAYDGKNQLFIAAANEGPLPGQTVAMAADPDETLKEVWRVRNMGVIWGQISTANGVCFVPDNNNLRILDCRDGSELNTISVSGTIGSAPSISEGRVFFGAGFSYALNDGTVQSGRELVALGLP